MAKRVKDVERPAVQVPAPVKPACPDCGSTRLRKAYTQPFPESGFRRITADCVDCGRVVWWNEEYSSN